MNMFTETVSFTIAIALGGFIANVMTSAYDRMRTRRAGRKSLTASRAAQVGECCGKASEKIPVVHPLNAQTVHYTPPKTGHPYLDGQKAPFGHHSHGS